MLVELLVLKNREKNNGGEIIHDILNTERFERSGEKGIIEELPLQNREERCW